MLKKVTFHNWILYFFIDIVEIRHCSLCIGHAAFQCGIGFSIRDASSAFNIKEPNTATLESCSISCTHSRRTDPQPK